MNQDEPQLVQTADLNLLEPDLEPEKPVEFYPPVPAAPILGPAGLVLALATFFYFFL
jgi:hypothetical protein